MITIAGYPGESHSVTTRDGYVLGLQRIPYGRTGKTSKIIIITQSNYHE